MKRIVKKEERIYLKKRWKSKTKWIMVGILFFVICLALVGFCFRIFQKSSEDLQSITKITFTLENCPAGDTIEPKRLTVMAIGTTEDGKNISQRLSADRYMIEPEQVPEHGHDFELRVTLKENPKIQISEKVRIKREELKRYEIGRSNPKKVQAILYKNGDLEIVGTGEVKKFQETALPWKNDTVSYLTWIDPRAVIESMDFWFSGQETFEGMTCSVPDSVKSMVRTFYGCTAMTSVPDMTTAVNLEDLTACYSNSAVTGGGQFPGNLKSAEETFKNCSELLHAADTSACVRLKNMKNCYSGCINLSDTSTPDCVENLEGTYQNCLNIKTANIPSKVKNMDLSFAGCTSLEKVTGEIPTSCTNVSGTFRDCKFLSGTIDIHCSVTDISQMFAGAARNGKGLTVAISWEGEESKQTSQEILQNIQEEMERQIQQDGSSITVRILEKNE